ncbi:hypothetical protein [Bacillus thuringiensis]|uniref:hypothetical protein n=1 Tax=Bacillus thuringiensis TaxID=1428 RepID=UPI000BACCCD6|nr:hypothetical protein CKQ70_11600 [Bacillus toyonensis]PAW47000.1 hypothetical protein CKQ69_08695 [Bacillus toyonensis]PGW45999.1 hypothetical protein COE03_16365 [Bacillus thuringiensis]
MSKKIRREKLEKAYINLRIARTEEVIRNARTKLIYEKGWIAYGKDITTKANSNRGIFARKSKYFSN